MFGFKRLKIAKHHPYEKEIYFQLRTGNKSVFICSPSSSVKLFYKHNVI